MNHLHITFKIHTIDLLLLHFSILVFQDTNLQRTQSSFSLCDLISFLSLKILLRKKLYQIFLQVKMGLCIQGTQDGCPPSNQ